MEKKVLIVFNHPAPYKVNLFNELNKYIPIEVVFERSRAKNRHLKFYMDNKFNFPYSFINKGNFNNENSFNFQIKKIIKNNKYDLIIMNGYSTISELIAINYMNKHHIPWTLFINGGLIKNDHIVKKHIKTNIISSAKNYISPCLEADKYLNYYGAIKNIYHYPNSTIFEKDVLNKPLNEKEKQQLKIKLGLDLKKTFIAPCQFIKRKNNVFLLNIFKDLPQFNLLLIGSGKQLHKYQRIILKNKMNNVKIIPYLSKGELDTYYMAGDALINLSKEDIYCHTVNEAMAKGLPVIASKNIVAALHLIKNGENGYLVNKNDKIDIVNALNDVNNNMAYNCLISAKENTIEKSALKISEIIKKLL